MLSFFLVGADILSGHLSPHQIVVFRVGTGISLGWNEESIQVADINCGSLRALLYNLHRLLSAPCLTIRDGVSLFSAGWHLARSSIPLIVNYSQNMALSHCGCAAAIIKPCDIADMHRREDASSSSGWHLKEQSAATLHVC